MSLSSIGKTPGLMYNQLVVPVVTVTAEKAISKAEYAADNSQFFSFAFCGLRFADNI